MAFIRVKRRGIHEYAYLVRSYRTPEGPKHETLAYLGRADLVTPDAIPLAYRGDPAVDAWLGARLGPSYGAYREDKRMRVAELRRAIAARDDAEVERLVARGVEALGPWPFVEEVLVLLQYEVGVDWLMGRITSSEEHMVTEHASRIIERVRSRHAAPPRRDAVRVLLANPEGEQHSLGLHVLAARIESLGHVSYVSPGAAPPQDVSLFARRVQPDLALLSVTLPANRAAALAVTDLLLRETRALVALGGQAWLDAPRLRSGPRVRVVRESTGSAVVKLLREAAGSVA